ncbi:MAG: sugar-binding domain-containing protein [Armatimonadota bacterium]
MPDWKLYDHRSVESIIEELGSVPRPEYPRPESVRPDWLNLNGVWEFAFDPEDTGAPEKPLDNKIVVPFCPESVLSGVYDEDLHTICRYARFFDLPQNLIGRRVLLHFGAVDHESDVRLNGVHLGKHIGGYDSFSFDVTDILKPTGNRLALRVYDNPDDIKQRGKQSPARYPEGCRYMRITGIWQTVWLEAVGNTYIKDWLLQDNIETGELKIEAEIDGPAKDLIFTAIAYSNGKEVARQSAEVGELSLTIPNHLLWSPESPNLYDLRLSLSAPDGGEVDSVDTYFGFRNTYVKNGKIYFNDKVFFLISALDQGYYPDGLYTPPTDDALRADVEWAKKYGLNNVRKHQIIAEPRFHYWCDKLGLTIWEEMPDWGTEPDFCTDADQHLREWTACMKRDINHPCIIAWIPKNEEQKWDNADASAVKVRFYEATKSLDPTRPVIDNSGFCHTITDMVDLHIRPLPGEDWHMWFARWRKEINEAGNFQAYDYAPTYCDGFKYRGEPLVISETGNWWIEDHPPMGKWRPNGTGPAANLEEYMELYKKFFLELMSEPECAGFSFVQLYDVEGEVNGYLTYDRKVKVSPEFIADVHAQGIKLRESIGELYD